VTLLIKFGAKLSVLDAKGLSPLAYAVRHECNSCLKTLFMQMERRNKGQFYLSLIEHKDKNQPNSLAITEQLDRSAPSTVLANVPLRFLQGCFPEQKQGRKGSLF